MKPSVGVLIKTTCPICKRPTDVELVRQEPNQFDVGSIETTVSLGCSHQIMATAGAALGDAVAAALKAAPDGGEAWVGLRPDRASPQPSAGLTDLEVETVELAGRLWNNLCRVVADGPTRSRDLGELCAHIHAIQRTVMAQAAARAHPHRFRLLGGPPATSEANPAE